jgi:hypothetical protein
LFCGGGGISVRLWRLNQVAQQIGVLGSKFVVQVQYLIVKDLISLAIFPAWIIKCVGGIDTLGITPCPTGQRGSTVPTVRFSILRDVVAQEDLT